MKRWQVFEYAKKCLDEIYSKNYHGYGNIVPSNYHRGVEMLDGDFRQAFLRSVWIYYNHHKMLPDLIDPQTFTEKQVLFKFFGLIPKLCPSDKLLTYKFMSTEIAKTVKIPKIIWRSKMGALPENEIIPAGRYFLKSNHGSGTNRAVNFPLSSHEREKLEKLTEQWLAKIHDSRKALWWYETMDRYVYLEEDISDGGKDAPDWKFFTCNGKVELFQVDIDRTQTHVQTIYTRAGRFINKELYYKSGSPVKMPNALEEMVAVAEDIGKKFDFIRVDMFVRQGTIFLGEIGLVPNGATRAIRSSELDWKLGAAWHAPWMGKVDEDYSTGHYAY